MNGNFPRIDPRAARRRFARAAGTYASAARLEAEVASRMMERLDYVTIAPSRVLDAGAGGARDARALAARYGAPVVALDAALPMVPRRSWPERLRRVPLSGVCADFERLPFGDGAFDLAWSNMALHWAADPLAALKEFHRALRPEGLLLFSTLGPDTLRELREAAGAQRVHAFLDMHDLGDMLVEAGFAAPVMDMEMITITYSDPDSLLRDLRESGQTCARADRLRGLSGRGFARRLRERIAAEGKASYEVVYGHAWKAAPTRLPDGRAIVQFRGRKG